MPWCRSMRTAGGSISLDNYMPQEIPKYYSIPESVLAKACPEEYAAYKKADDALVKAVGPRDDDGTLGGLRSYALYSRAVDVLRNQGSKYHEYQEALRIALILLKKALATKGISSTVLVNLMDGDEIKWFIPGNEMYEVTVRFKGRAIIDALGCWACDLEPVD